MAQKKVYDEEFKIQAVKLGKEIGFSKAAIELGINPDTLYGGNRALHAAHTTTGEACCLKEFYRVTFQEKSFV